MVCLAQRPAGQAGRQATPPMPQCQATPPMPQCLQLHPAACRLEELALPVDAGQLEQAHAAAQAAAAAKFERERFGSQVAGLREALEAALQREYRWGRAVLHCSAMP